jgi:hypothetical protein
MSQLVRALVVLAIVSASDAAWAERLFRLDEGGQTFVYRARPGDHPGAVAEMFGLTKHDMAAFLAANGISDATRVPPGFEYKVPNRAVQDLGRRATRLETKLKRVARDLAREKERNRELVRTADATRDSVAAAETRAQDLARIGTLWPWAKAAMVLLVLALAGAFVLTQNALKRQTQAERFARNLARELDEKRQAAMTERQESARRIVDLEQRLRTLEAQLGPRVVISGRTT